ncbi:MAG: hypothetical protein GF383_07270 [Candidatus Lokiarchaeota archaeon]|nr:hypothetical protein [Candidatus Lokiarchaeota archaeon]MBD3339968.1 hypothetical protein [Candidatus Lokiarchaeota archaeon]
MKGNPKGPDFIGIGAMKAASGWIFKSLERHPEICGEAPKEHYFFNKTYNYKKGIEFYLASFKKCPKNLLKGEFTPSYMLSPESSHRIYKHFPNVKLIVCLRNPADRAYSDYRYNIQWHGRFTMYENFEEVMKHDSEFMERGFYFKQLKPYFELFPRNNILITFYEDLKKDSKKFLKQIYRFLELKNTAFFPTFLDDKINPTGVYIVKSKIPFLTPLLYRISSVIKRHKKLKGRIEKFGLEKTFTEFLNFNKRKITGKNEEVSSIPPLNEETRKFLIQSYYREDIKELERLIDKDLSFWE